MAELLIDVADPDEAACVRLSFDELLRARAILQRKRVDDALPLLPNLTRHAALCALAEVEVKRSARVPRGAALADAWSIAERALGEAQLERAARADRLLLRARFAGPDGSGALAARRGPFVGFERDPDGRRLWAIKGIGINAAVHVYRRSDHGTKARELA